MLRATLCLLVGIAGLLPAQRNELSLQFGTTLTQRREIGVPALVRPFIGTDVLREDNGVAGGLVYRFRVWGNDGVSVSAELPLFVVQATNTELVPAGLSSFFGNTSGASAFLTPGIAVRLLPDARLSPVAFFGVGYARVLEAQVSLQELRAYFANEGTWALDYGAGLDLRLVRFLSLRGELRNFRTGGSSAFDLLPEAARQRNTLVFSGGLVLRF